MESIRTYIAARVTAMRKRRGLTQLDLSERVGINPVSISRIETGVTTPTIETLYAISNALDVEVQSFFPASALDRPELPLNRMRKEAALQQEILTAHEDGLDAALAVLRSLKK